MSTLLALAETSPEEAGRAIGRYAGSGMLGIALCVGVIVAIASARKPGVNGKGAYALAFALLSWIVASCFGAFELAKNRTAAVLFGFVLFVFAIVAIVLGTVALLEMASKQEKQKKGQAIWALVLASITGLAFGGGFVRGLLTRSSADKELAVAKPSAAGELRVYPELNYSFQIPAEPWQELNAPKLNPQASFAVRRAEPEVYLIVIAEKTGGELTSEALDEISQANLEKVAKSSDLKWEKPLKLHGLDGYAHRIDAKVNDQRFTYVVWALSHAGYLYQVVAWGNASDGADVEAQAMKTFKNFAVLKADESPPL